MMQSNSPDSGDLPPRKRNISNATTSSNAAPSSRPPIREAVNTAFDSSDAASQVDPNLVAQITEQVISSLKASGITGGASINSPGFPPASQPYSHIPPLHQPTPNGQRNTVPGSPTSAASSQIPSRYTPPSPNRRESSDYGSDSPERLSDRASSTSRETRSSRRDSKASATGSEELNTARGRKKPVRVPSSVEETTLEKIWRPLFDAGRPTPRLGQFLRGLAKHIIEDCEPKNSIVVTPGKLADFFEATKLSEEIYPWNAIFGGRLTNASISRLFRDLRCQHHLVQFQYHDTPSIPGLTPYGFDAFMTVLIQAHPEQESERLSKAVLAMPISNAEDSKERFPKELSRRLFPQSDDLQQQQRIVAAITADPAIQLNKNPIPPPPSTQPPSVSQSTSQSSSQGERDRNPYSSSNSFSSVVDDDDLSTTPIPIERERKPYTAREGGGKTYENDRYGNNTGKPDTGSRLNRANSVHPTQPQAFSQSRPSDIPNSVPRAHRMSMNAGSGGLRYGVSPVQTSNQYTRSEGTNVGDIPPSQYASNMYADPYEDPRNPRRPSRRKNTDEDIAKGFGIPPPRINPGQGYEYPAAGGYGTPRGPGGTDGYGSFPGGYTPSTPHTPRY